ncbi:hypothetical protein Hanom_Chr05g00446481 [Helianthus anomalus]
MVNQYQLRQLQYLLNMLSYKRLLSQAPICMVNHNQLPQSKAIGLLEYHHFLIQTTVKQELRFMPKLSRM